MDNIKHAAEAVADKLGAKSHEARAEASKEKAKDSSGLHTAGDRVGGAIGQ